LAPMMQQPPQPVRMTTGTAMTITRAAAGPHLVDVQGRARGAQSPEHAGGRDDAHHHRPRMRDGLMPDSGPERQDELRALLLGLVHLLSSVQDVPRLGLVLGQQVVLYLLGLLQTGLGVLDVSSERLSAERLNVLAHDDDGQRTNCRKLLDIHTTMKYVPCLIADGRAKSAMTENR